MLHRKNKQLRVVREAEQSAHRTGQEGLFRKMEQEIKKQKTSFRRKVIIGTLGVAVAAAAVFLFVYLQTYTKARVLHTYKIGNAADNSYREFADGVLKYSRDGISYLNQKGEEQWNQPYQIKNPLVEISSDTAAVADRGGNDIIVFQKDGLKGEIRTTLPVEKLTVSEQGIVGAVLKNESSPQIMCYDAAGNVLAELKSSMSGRGYPVDVALSADGETMQVVYLSVKGTGVTSRVCYYNFGEKGAEKTDHLMMEKEYQGSILASGFFVDESVSAVVGDQSLTLFDGKSTPKEVTEISVKEEIQSVFHSEKYVGLIVKREGKSGYELRLYNTSGRSVLTKAFEGTYKTAKISGSQVIMYDGKKCSIYTRNGIHRFEGEMDHNILEIIPVGGVNKYIVMNANGMENVRLVK